ncbi:3-hydroxyisobutyrate dehydrogenase [Loktanella sp. S4079]|nr:3-hydroxyisobutyrate dehydrogenase [Loktanella sp. S4079]
MAFVGFGEAAQAFVSGWGDNKPDMVSAFDIKSNDHINRDDLLNSYTRHGVAGQDDIIAALRGADAVFSLVTADQAEVAARAAVSAIGNGTLWLDCNSCSPETKRRAAQHITKAGGRYVDVAVMAPVHPKQHKVPLLLSGACAQDAAHLLAGLEMNGTVVGDQIGDASAIKMLRSIMIKGMEALSAECLLAARKAGVEVQVIASLNASNPQINWEAQGAYNLERMLSHGTRRAAEMREVCATLSELGLDNSLSAATAQWQDRIAGLTRATSDQSLNERLDRVLDNL